MSIREVFALLLDKCNPGSKMDWKLSRIGAFWEIMQAREISQFDLVGATLHCRVQDPPKLDAVQLLTINERIKGAPVGFSDVSTHTGPELPCDPVEVHCHAIQSWIGCDHLEGHGAGLALDFIQNPAVPMI